MHIPTNESGHSLRERSTAYGLLALPFLTAAAAVLLSQLPRQFSLIIAVYVVCTVAYSMRLKDAPILDLIVLAFLFTLRLVGGMVADRGRALFAVAAQTFSMFFFFSVASIKRYDEVRMMAARGTTRSRGPRLPVVGRSFPDDTRTDGRAVLDAGLFPLPRRSCVARVQLCPSGVHVDHLRGPRLLARTRMAAGEPRRHAYSIRCCSRCATACRSRWVR